MGKTLGTQRRYVVNVMYGDTPLYLMFNPSDNGYSLCKDICKASKTPDHKTAETLMDYYFKVSNSDMQCEIIPIHVTYSTVGDEE